jgi:NAD(P)-dependent dehydrogenase (short-subunit alcohol dehydrogenase family)
MSAERAHLDLHPITALVTGATAGIDRLAAEAGEIDVLVNNAGRSVWAPTEDLKVSDYDSMFASNIRATSLARPSPSTAAAPPSEPACSQGEISISTGHHAWRT